MKQYTVQWRKPNRDDCYRDFKRIDYAKKFAAKLLKEKGNELELLEIDYYDTYDPIYHTETNELLLYKQEVLI